jgi:hypothetical protein
MENIGTYNLCKAVKIYFGHLVYYIFGNLVFSPFLLYVFYGNLIIWYFSPFWYILSIKIWQPCTALPI